MTIQQARVGQIIQGPSGGKYRVTSIRGDKVRAMPLFYTQVGIEQQSVDLDKVALERFVVDDAN